MCCLTPESSLRPTVPFSRWWGLSGACAGPYSRRLRYDSLPCTGRACPSTGTSAVRGGRRRVPEVTLELRRHRSRPAVVQVWVALDPGYRAPDTQQVFQAMHFNNNGCPDTTARSVLTKRSGCVESSTLTRPNHEVRLFLAQMSARANRLTTHSMACRKPCPQKVGGAFREEVLRIRYWT